MNARFYDSNTGRFLSQDSYSGNAYEPWSQHLYSYCGNNPVNMIDPTGHCPVIPVAIGLWELVEVALVAICTVVTVNDTVNTMQQLQDAPKTTWEFPLSERGAITLGSPPMDESLLPRTLGFPMLGSLSDPTTDGDYVFEPPSILPFPDALPETDFGTFVQAKKRDLKQVKDAAKQVGVDYKDLSDYMHDEKGKGKRNDDNFSYKELLEMARQIKEWSGK